MSCLFNSLGRLLHLSQDTVRQQICDALEHNIPILEGFNTTDLLAMEHPNYIQHMRNPSTWGGAIEIQVACIVWKLKIEVENRRTYPYSTIEFYPVGNADSSIELPVARIYWTGGHYEPISFTPGSHESRLP